MKRTACSMLPLVLVCIAGCDSGAATPVAAPSGDAGPSTEDGGSATTTPDSGTPTALDADRDPRETDGGRAPSPGLGAVALLSDPCEAGPIPGATCTTVRVTCPGVPDIDAMVREAAPAPGTTARGAILFGLGGAGGGWYDGGRFATDALTQLTRDGFWVVERAWKTGWEVGPGGMAAVSCRYATLLTWVRERHAEGALCATGNSGGSGEIGFALARWGRGAILDFAMPTGGPVFSRTDIGCLDGDDATWRAMCAAGVPEGASTCSTFACSYREDGEWALGFNDDPYTPDTPCGDADESFRETFLANSILAPGNVLDYPQTPLHFLFGDGDCTGAIPQGFLFIDAVTSAKRVSFVPNTPHNVASTMDGAQALLHAMEESCTLRH